MKYFICILKNVPGKFLKLYETMKCFICILLCLLLCACVTSITFRQKSLGNSNLQSTKKREYTIPSFLFGLANTSEKIKTWKECPANWKTIKITRSFLHILTAGLTLGIYTPFKVIIICSIQKKDILDEFEQFNEKDPPEDLLEDMYNNQPLKL